MLLLNDFDNQCFMESVAFGFRDSMALIRGSPYLHDATFTDVREVSEGNKHQLSAFCEKGSW